MRVVLASQSPRRRQLLSMLGLSFTTRPSVSPEVWNPLESPEENACRLALEKVTEICTLEPDALILGADTIVILQGRVLGKPTDEEEARAMLGALSDNRHSVVTGVALALTDPSGHPIRTRTFHVSTEVSFAPLNDVEIEAYIDSGSPMDKAGGYGIQDDKGALFVKEIRGDYYNVVGLPLQTLYQVIREEAPEISHQMLTGHKSTHSGMLDS